LLAASLGVARSTSYTNKLDKGKSTLSAKAPSKHQLHVRSLFVNLRTLSGCNGEAISELEQRALARKRSWKSELTGHLDAYVATGRLTADQRRSLIQEANKCEGGTPELLDFAVPALWTCLIAIISFLAWSLSQSMVTIGAVMCLCAAVGGVWGWRQHWLDPAGNVNAGWQRPLFSLACAAIGIVFALELPTLTGELMQAQSMHAFNVDRAAVLRDPKAFPFLKKFARENFDVDVVLGTAAHSWATTSLALPGSSVASMHLGYGYCQLNLQRDNVLARFGTGDSVDKTLWIQGVMMHEFGHCLDLRRDMSDVTQHKVKTYSIAPVDAGQVKDLDTYLEATEKASTQLWREALADTFAIGFWRLAAPQEAGKLTAALEHTRSASKDDTTHSTSCWIKFAAAASAPQSPGHLLQWADTQRAKAPCSVIQPQRTSAFDEASQWVKKQIERVEQRLL
jgi:hypothetical protein